MNRPPAPTPVLPGPLVFIRYRLDLCLHRLLFGLVIVLVLLAAGCERQAPVVKESSGSPEMRTFTGRWTAIGNRQTMALETGHESAVFRLSGSLLLEGEQRLKKGFHAELLGFFDNRSGLIGRSVWTDERGDQVYSELQGGTDLVGEDITGTFTGGTGRFAGVIGSYTFKWQRLSSGEHEEISGRVVDFQGWARLPPRATGTTGERQ